MSDGDGGPWVAGTYTGGCSSRKLHSDRECWRLNRANHVREATDAEVDELGECMGRDCADPPKPTGTGEGHRQSLLDAAAARSGGGE